MEGALERLVWSRATATCEYCRIEQGWDTLPFGIDHIIAQKHHGGTVESNLAIACFNCNTYKGPNIAGLDPLTGELTRLFNPRTDLWDEHFEWNGAELVGRTAVGRTTCDVLAVKHPDRLEHRKLLIADGRFFT